MAIWEIVVMNKVGILQIKDNQYYLKLSRILPNRI